MSPCLEPENRACLHAVGGKTRRIERCVILDPEGCHLEFGNSISGDVGNYTKSTPSEVSFSSLQDQ